MRCSRDKSRVEVCDYVFNMKESEMFEVCIWPDGSWVLRDEYSEEEWKWSGDDFRIVFVPDGMSSEEIDQLISEGDL